MIIRARKAEMDITDDKEKQKWKMRETEQRSQEEVG